MWAMVFRIAVVAVYGYIIVLSLWAMRVQRTAATAPHHRYDHPAMSHVVERSAHGYIASVLIASLAVRLAELTLDITPWLLVPLTILAALLTVPVLTGVWRMAIEDLHNWYIGLLNKLKTTVLLVCAAGLLIDQVWRVVTLFWL
jgi:hypothetical protein